MDWGHTLNTLLLIESSVEIRLTFSQDSSLPYAFLRISVESFISGRGAYFPMTSR